MRPAWTVTALVCLAGAAACGRRTTVQRRRTPSAGRPDERLLAP